MTRDEYLQILRDNLTTMTDDEKDDVIRYYLEYFSDSGNIQATMEELGAPEKLAGRLCNGDSSYSENYQGSSRNGTYTYSGNDRNGTYTYAGNSQNGGYTYSDSTQYGENKKKKSTGKMIALMCTFPLWLPFAIAGVCIALGFAIVAVTIVASIFFVFAVLVLAGIACIAAGVVGFAKSAADGIVLLGGGLIAIGVGILMFLCGSQIVKAISKGIRKILKRD